MMASKARVSTSVIAERAIAILLGIILARSAFAHLSNPYAFLDAILAYDLVTGFPAMVAAHFIPPFQLALSVALIFGWWRNESCTIALLLFLMFVAIQLSAVLRGLDVSCGCFGMAASVRIGLATIGFSASCAIAAATALALAWRQRS